MIFWDFKFFSDCCGERKGDATSFLLRFVSFVNYVPTLFMCENCTAIGSGDNVQCKQMKFLLYQKIVSCTPLLQTLAITDTKPRPESVRNNGS